MSRECEEDVLQVELIGRVRLSVDGEEVEINRRQLRLMMAVLALHPGKLVTQDALIDAMWGGTSPASRLHTLHVYISRLRSLHPELKSRLVTGESAYGLDVHPSSVDLSRLEAAVSRLRGNDDWSDEEGRLILNQCKGELLLGFQYEEFAQTPIRRYRRLRRDLIATGARHAVQRGTDPSEWIAALEELLEEDALDDQLWDALVECFESQGRLTEANDAKWRRDREFAQMSSTEPRPWPLIDPRGRGENRILIGRDQELAELITAMSDTRLISIVGAPGVGKTHLAHHLALHEPTKSRWVGFESSATAVEALCTDLGVSGLPSALTPDQLAESIRFFGELIVLDGCEHVTEEVVQFVTASFSVSEDARFVATSRRPLGIPGEKIYRLEGLSVAPADARTLSDGGELLSIYAGNQSLALAKLNYLAERLDGVPLALQLAGSMTSRLGAERATLLIDDPDWVANEPIVQSGSPELTIAHSVQRSVAVLDEAESLIFRRSAWISTGFRSEDILQVAPELDARTSSLALDSLVDQSLVEYHGSTYTVLWALASAARMISPDPVGDREAHARWVLKHVRRLAPDLYGAQAVNAHRELKRFGRDIRDALAYALDHDSELAATLSAELGWHWHCQGDWRQLESVAARAADNSIDCDPEIRLGCLATHMMIQFDLRHIGVALDVAELGAEEAEANLVTDQLVRFEAMRAAASSTTGEFESGIVFARRARALADQLDSAWHRAVALFAEASLHMNRDTNHLAIEACEEILSIQDCDPLLWSAAAFVLARERRRVGRVDEARRLIDASVAALSELGEPLFRTLSKVEQAIVLLEQGHEIEPARILVDAARHSLAREDPMETVPCFRALSLAALMSGRYELAVALNAAAELRRHRAKWDSNPWDLQGVSEAVTSAARGKTSGADLAVTLRSAEILTDREIVDLCEREFRSGRVDVSRRPTA